MSSNDAWFDGLAKDAARGLSRRQMFRRLLGGTAVAVFGMIGAARVSAKDKFKDCSKLCEECCHNAFPNGGREYGQCVSDCHHGQGLCGPIVCPEG
jgi:hypothetical protein